MLGVYESDDLVYVGHTGAGFSRASLEEVYRKLRPLARATSPFKVRPKTNTPVTWVEPLAVAQIRFQEWTADGAMRHPLFLGLRTDKSAREVVRERPKALPQPSAARRGEGGES